MERQPEYSKTVEIDGFKYLINHPQVEEAWEIGIQLLQMIGGSAAAMAGGGKDEASAAAALSVAVEGLLKRVDGKGSMLLIKRLLRNVEVQGPVDGETKKFLLDGPGIQKQFHAGLGSMLKLVGEVLAFTHRDFFEAIGSGVASLMTMAGEKSAN